MKRLLSLLTTTLLMCSLCLTQGSFLIPVKAAGISTLSVWTVDNLTKIFKSTQMPDNSSTSITLNSAKNDRRAAQIAIRSADEVSNLSITASALTGPGGETIAAGNIHATLEAYIHLTQHTGGLSEDNKVVAPDGSMDYPDRITNDTSLSSLAADTTQPIWYSVYIPSDAAAGTYTGVVTVNSSQASATVVVSLNVYDVTLPDTDESSYKVDNWFMSGNYFNYQYGVTTWSSQWWTVIGNIAQYMKTHRNNVVFVDPVACLAPDCQIDDNGNYTFDWTKFDTYVQTFADAGAMEYIQGSSLMGKMNNRFVVFKLEKVDGVVKTVLVTAQSTEANNWLNIYLPALKNHLQAKGWLDKFYQSGGDEPSTSTDYSDDNWIYGKIYALAPGIKTIEANMQYSSASEGKLDTYVVKQNVYEGNKDYYEGRQDAGDEVWVYVCNTPSGKYLGRYIDSPLAETLLTQWYTFKNDMSGYLHWGFDFWTHGSISNYKKVTASSSLTTGGWSASNVVDTVCTSTSDSMGWSSNDNLTANHTEWLEIDLGGERTIQTVCLFPRSDGSNFGNGFPVDFTVQVSTDNVNWTTVVTESSYSIPTEGGDTPTFTFNNTDARYVKVIGTNLRQNSSDGNYRMQFAEVQVYDNDDVIDEADTDCPGDCWLVYPDRDNLDLFSSIRSEVQLEGIEDWELLSLLSENQPELAKNLSNSLINSATNYTLNSSTISQARVALLQNLTGTGTNASFTDDCSSLTYTYGKSDLVHVLNGIPEVADGDNERFGRYGSQQLSFEDTCSDFTKMYSHSSSLIVNAAYATDIAEGDSGRVGRSDSTTQYFTYKMDNISSITTTVFYDSTPYVNLYASTDGVTWTSLTTTSDTPVSTGWGWSRVHISCSSIPSGTNYIKVELPNTNANAWAPQIGAVNITYEPIRGYVVYNRYNIRSFSARVYYEQTKNMSFYASPDYANWTKLDVSESTPVATNYGWYGVDMSCGDVPWGTNYLKVVFDQDNTYYWSPQLSHISITSGYGDTTQDVPFTDELDRFNQVYSKSVNISLASIYPDNIAEGDSSRAYRVSGDTGSIIYKRKNIKSCKIKLLYEATDYINIYTSSDGTNWTQVTPTMDTPAALDWGWYRNYATVTGLTNANYIKIDLPNTNQYCWVPQIGSVQLTYNPD